MSKESDEHKRQADFFRICEGCPIRCCSEVKPPVTSRRMTIIQDHLKTHGLVVENPFEKKVYWYPREASDHCCVFLDKDTKKCRIHTVKPETCVAGPITFDINPKTGKIEWFLKTEKICPLAGGLYRDKNALKSHLTSARKELLRLVNDLDTEALRAILKIEEPDTFKIGEEELAPHVLAKLKLSNQRSS